LKFEKNELIQRWSALSPREQLMAAAAGVFMVFYLLYSLLYQPLASETLALAQKIDAQRQTYQYLQNLAHKVESLRQALPAGENVELAAAGQSLMAVLDDSGQQMAIKPSIKRVIPDGADEVSLWLEAIDFDKLSHWLAVLETRHKIEISQTSINADANRAGVVNAKLVLNKAGKTGS